MWSSASGPADPADSRDRPESGHESRPGRCRASTWGVAGCLASAMEFWLSADQHITFVPLPIARRARAPGAAPGVASPG